MKAKWGFTIVLALCVVLGGCGKYTLKAEDADLTLVPNVILEPEKAPYNLGNWKSEDSVHFYFDIKKEGYYSITLEYAKDPNDSKVILSNNNGAALTVTLPSTGSDWSTYTKYKTDDVIWFEAGEADFFIRGADDNVNEYILNLRSVTFSYEGETRDTW